jgi:heme-degrading monooxygenase HmoA
MVTLFVRHQVNDYNQWKNAYDRLARVRQEKGVTGASVYRDSNDAAFVIVTHQFRNLDAANAFANSADLKSAMSDGGVAGPPEFWFGESVEQTAH